MTSTRVEVERLTFVSRRAFEDVLTGLYKGIGRPDMREFNQKLNQAASFADYEAAVKGVVGSADLMEFLRLDLGAVLAKDPAIKAYRIVRIIAGNPLIMREMVEHVPDAGAYAPVTILVYEREDGVHVSYDTMTSYLAVYGNAKALGVAADLDAKVVRLLQEATG